METSVSAGMKKANTQQLDETATSHLFEENGEKLENILFTELCICFVQPIKRTDERTCVNLWKVLEYSFSVLRKFILEYRTVHAMREKLREVAAKRLLSSAFEKIY